MSDRGARGNGWGLDPSALRASAGCLLCQGTITVPFNVIIITMVKMHQQMRKVGFFPSGFI